MGPAPVTTQTSPGWIRAFNADCMPTASGSTIARFGEADIVGQLVREGGRVDDLGRQAAVDRRRRPERDGGIEVVDSEARSARRRVGNSRLHADTVADRKRMDILADLDDRPRGLVPEDHRRFDDERPDAPVRVIVNIASANAHSVDADAHIRWPEFVFQLDFAKRQLPLLLEHKCLRLHKDHPKTSCLFERPASTFGDSINASGNPPGLTGAARQ